MLLLLTFSDINLHRLPESMHQTEKRDLLHFGPNKGTLYENSLCVVLVVRCTLLDQTTETTQLDR
jgi:hypothetical protein